MPTAIEWSDETWNPVTGCDRLSPGCTNCYALTLAKRLKAMGQPKYQNDGDPRTSGPGFKVTCHPDELDTPMRWRKPRKVFVNSMSDLAHPDVSDEFIGRVWQIMGLTPRHQYQILTKRPQRLARWAERWHAGDIPEPLASAEVEGFPGYRVNSLGQVFGPRRPDRPLAPNVETSGRLSVGLSRPGGGERRMIHRLVLEAFDRQRRPDEQCCHRNGDYTDNRLSNLRWDTQSVNAQERNQHGWDPARRLTEVDIVSVRRRLQEGASQMKVAAEHGISRTHVRNIQRGVHQRLDPDITPPAPPPARAVLSNVWLGTSIESDKYTFRADHLRNTPAALRFLSLEPLLGPLPSLDLTGIDWIIAGGESGPGARPMHPDWVRDIRDRCLNAGIPFLFKQWGAWAPPDQIDTAGWDDVAWHENGSMVHRDDGRVTHTSYRESADEILSGVWAEVWRVGKKKAGRRLDGFIWDQMPEVAA